MRRADDTVVPREPRGFEDFFESPATSVKDIHNFNPLIVPDTVSILRITLLSPNLVINPNPAITFGTDLLLHLITPIWDFSL